MMFSIPANYLIAGAAGAVVLLLALAWTLEALERRRRNRLHGFAAEALLARLVEGYRPELRLPLNPLVLLGCAALIVALAGPRWGAREVTDTRGSREILILLDTSESMNAANPPPDRLCRAREKISALLEAFPADRFGLIAFSGAAALECPLTRDHAYFKAVLKSVTTDSLTAEGTDIEAAFLEAEKLFAGEGNTGRSPRRDGRAILLISDGEAVSGDAVSAAGRLADFGTIFVMGIGDPEGAEVKLPQWMARTKYAPAGAATHHSVLDEEQLAAIAIAGDGVYVRSTLGGDDLAVIAREMAFLDSGLRAGDPMMRAVNRYRWPLAFAMLCFAGEGIWLACMPRLAGIWPAATGAEGPHGLA